MKLRDFKINQGFSISELAVFLNQPVPTIKAWLYTRQIPRQAELRMIYERTNGAVTPNDFVLDGKELDQDPDPPPEEEEDKEEPPLLEHIRKTAAE